jgi:hypothetical protein
MVRLKRLEGGERERERENTHKWIMHTHTKACTNMDMHMHTYRQMDRWTDRWAMPTCPNTHYAAQMHAP